MTPFSPLADLAPRPAVTVPGDASVREAVSAMEAHDVSALIVDDHRLVTERDIARALGHLMPMTAQVGGIGSPHALVVDGSVTVLEAGMVMVEAGVQHVVVHAEDHRAVLSLGDVTAVLVGHIGPPLPSKGQHRLGLEPTEIWLG